MGYCNQGVIPVSASPVLAGLASWRPTLHAPAEALRKALAPIGAWGLLFAPVTAVVELVSRLFVGWWRLTAPGVRWLNRYWLLWPVALPLFFVTHLFLWTLFGAMFGQWMPGIIGGGHAVGRAFEAYIAVNLVVMALVGVPARKAPDVEAATGWQKRVLMAVLNIPAAPLAADLKAMSEGDRIRTRAHRPSRVGDSYQVVVTLPAGMDAAKLASSHTGSIAGSLGLPEGRVDLSTDRRRSARDLVVRILDIALEDRDMGHMPVPTTRHPFFDGFTVGVNRIGDPLGTRIFERSAVVLGAAGSGKSYTLRSYASAAAIDPLVDLYVFSLRATVDFDPLGEAGVAQVHSGDDAKIIRTLRELVVHLSGDIDRRGQTLRSHGVEKLTPQIATDDPTMRPVVVVIDECHVGLRDKDIAAAVADLVKRARAVGIVLILASQEGNDTDIPRPITQNTAVGIALRVTTHTQVDNALGTGAYASGAHATKIPTDAPGTAWVRGLTDTIEKIKTYGTDLDALSEFARFAAEERAEWFSKHGGPVSLTATDDDVIDQAPADLLDHVATVMEDRAVMTRREVLAGLQAIDPDRYGDWATKDLSRELKGWGIPAQQGTAPGASGRQAVLTLEALNDAIAAR